MSVSGVDNPFIEGIIIIILGFILIPVFDSLSGVIQTTEPYASTIQLLLLTPYLILIVGIVILTMSVYSAVSNL